MHVRYSYLPQQFSEIDDLLDRIRSLAQQGDFTLGAELARFEARFAELIGSRHALGVGSGTDALKLSLKALGVGFGDEVITAANSFVATAGAIAELGARPVFVDCDDSFCMNVDQVEDVISDKTRAIVPVHYTGAMTDMRKLMPVATTGRLPVVEDACQAILGELDQRRAGTWGTAGAFSLHPLKNLNVWGDGGVIVTGDDELANTLGLLRNHGMTSRDEIALLGCNSRLDTLQALVGNWLIGQAENITSQRIDNARYYDEQLGQLPEISLPARPARMRCVFHLYVVFAQNRDELYRYCRDKGIECKIHYPVPLYRQKGLAFLGYRAGAFPVADRHAASMITFPCDQHLTRRQQDYVVKTVKEFYAGSS